MLHSWLKLKSRMHPLRWPDSYIAAVNTARYLEGKNRILIVGDAGGRDWRYLRELGKEIFVLDLSPQQHLPDLYVQSIEQRTPFADGFFDGVVMNEVLEHLFQDVQALEEVRRILRSDGVLVVTVPYFSNQQDVPEFHVRIHSQRTIRRLLERCGFAIEEHFYRGFISSLPHLGFVPRILLFGWLKIAESIYHNPDRAIRAVNKPLEKIERMLGSHTVTMRFQKFFTSFGGIIKARPSMRRDFDHIQKEHFANRDYFSSN